MEACVSVQVSRNSVTTRVDFLFSLESSVSESRRYYAQPLASRLDCVRIQERESERVCVKYITSRRRAKDLET